MRASGVNSEAKFRYLGSTLAEYWGCEVEIEERIMQGEERGEKMLEWFGIRECQRG